MVKGTAFITGLILSVMIFFNGKLSDVTSPYFSNAIYHGIGFAFYGILLWIARNRISTSKFKAIYILPGIMGSLTLIINNYVMSTIGITLMVAYGLLGQVLTSLVIDSFGLLGKKKDIPNMKQWLGILVMSIGLFIMVL